MTDGFYQWQFWRAGVLALLLAVFAIAAHAEEVEAVAEVTSVAEARPFWIAVPVVPEADSMISWIDTGTGGRGISVALDLPDGFEKGKTLLPAPIDIGAFGQHAFLSRFWVLQEILPPRTFVYQDRYRFAGRIISHQYHYIEETFSDVEVSFAFALAFGPGQAASNAVPVFAAARAAIPMPFPWPAIYRGDEQTFELILFMSPKEAEAITSLYLIPAQGAESIFLNQTLRLDTTPEGLKVTADPPPGFMAGKRFAAILLLRDAGQETAYDFAAKNVLEEGKGASLSDPDFAGYTLWLALGFAILGGILLNLMPCVFPVLTLKVFTLVKSGSRGAGDMRLDGLAYTAGILLSFLIVALLLLTFRQLGQQVGWGFQLQSPWFIALLIAILFVVALVFLGVINIRLPFAIESRPKADGPLGSFYTGMLATVVATPCTAPFMASALGFALTLNTLSAIAVFMGLGLGLAAPYLVVSFIPKIQSIFPKPGPWMITFKKILAIPILLTVGWLGWVWSTQTGEKGAQIADYAVQWSPDAVWSARLQGRGVFVNYTATWCLTCLVNERLVFRQDKFQRFLADNNIIYMEADWTSPNPAIAKSLENLGRSGLPVYAFYPPGGPAQDVVLLPEVLTLEGAIERISANLE